MIQFDCHAHVYEKVKPIATARYLPKNNAPLSSWLSKLTDHGLKGGVIVQVSFLGTDNSELCNALRGLDQNHFAGVAVVPLDVSDDELTRLESFGVKGIRWNLIRGAQTPDLQSAQVKSFLERIYSRGMHVEIHLESPALAKLVPALLAFGGVVVVDHFGLPSEQNPSDDPWLQTLTSIKDLSGLYVKMSGAYRTAFDTSPHAEALSQSLCEDRLIWGSDWPHTQHETMVDYQSVARTKDQLPTTSDAIAVQSLYGLNGIN